MSVRPLVLAKAAAEQLRGAGWLWLGCMPMPWPGAHMNETLGKAGGWVVALLLSGGEESDGAPVAASRYHPSSSTSTRAMLNNLGYLALVSYIILSTFP